MDYLTEFYFNKIKELEFYDKLLEIYEDDQTIINNIETTLTNEDKKPIFYDPNKNISYDVQNSIFDTLNEKHLFLKLEKLLENKFRILPEVCFRRVIQTDKYQGRDLSLYKFADFFICDKNTFLPLLSIEFDEESHREDLYQILRDISKNETLNSVNLPHLTICGTSKILNDKEINKIAKNIVNEINKILE